MRALRVWLIGLSVCLAVLPADAVEVAPRITDREIVERLTALDAGHKKLEARIDETNRRIDSLERSLNARIDGVERSLNARIDGVKRSLNARIDDLRAEMNSRFDTLTWLISLFVTIAMVTLGFVLRMQWQLQQRQTRVETSLETQQDEIAFLKSLIEKLLPPRTAL